MAEQKTAQQQVREQILGAENAAENAFRALGDLSFATTEFLFGVAEKGLGYNVEMHGQADRVLQETFTNYHKVYQDGIKAWQGYVQGINEIFHRKI